jgi:hypothetical protein
MSDFYVTDICTSDTCPFFKFSNLCPFSNFQTTSNSQIYGRFSLSKVSTLVNKTNLMKSHDLYTESRFSFLAAFNESMSFFKQRPILKSMAVSRFLKSTSLTYTLILTNKSAIDLIIWKGRRFFSYIVA